MKTLVCPWLKNYNIKARAVVFVILLQNKNYKFDKVLINHEKIHLRQQLEMLWVGFLLFYCGQYLYFRLRGKKHYEAYRSLWHEREAYAFEKNLNYLKTRKFLAVFKYKLYKNLYNILF